MELSLQHFEKCWRRCMKVFYSIIHHSTKAISFVNQSQVCILWNFELFEFRKWIYFYKNVQKHLKGWLFKSLKNEKILPYGDKIHKISNTAFQPIMNVRPLIKVAQQSKTIPFCLIPITLPHKNMNLPYSICMYRSNFWQQTVHVQHWKKFYRSW